MSSGAPLASEMTARGASTTEVMLAGTWRTAHLVAHYSAGATAERFSIGDGTRSESLGRWGVPPRRSAQSMPRASSSSSRAFESADAKSPAGTATIPNARKRTKKVNTRPPMVIGNTSP